MSIIPNVKVGVSYNLFDGEELLEASIKSIRDKVDYISVIYQLVSYTGNPASPDLEEKLNQLVNKGLIDQLYLYTPASGAKARYSEATKRDIGLSLAKKQNCNYFMAMDVDEFYDGEEFEDALKYIVQNNITTSAVSIIEYYKSPEYQFSGIHTFASPGDYMYNCYVPFLIKIDDTVRQLHGTMYFPCKVDPTRNLNYPGMFKLFSVQEIAMHHMSTIRKDLVKKFANSSGTEMSEMPLEKMKEFQKYISDFDFDKSNKLPEGYAICGQRLLKKVENKFNINFDEIVSATRKHF